MLSFWRTDLVMIRRILQKLEVDNCGTPEIPALLYPIIESGKITHVRVLVSGKGYDPLRINITANQDDNKVINTLMSGRS